MTISNRDAAHKNTSRLVQWSVAALFMLTFLSCVFITRCSGQPPSFPASHLDYRP